MESVEEEEAKLTSPLIHPQANVHNITSLSNPAIVACLLNTSISHRSLSHTYIHTYYTLRLNFPDIFLPPTPFSFSSQRRYLHSCFICHHCHYSPPPPPPPYPSNPPCSPSPSPSIRHNQNPPNSCKSKGGGGGGICNVPERAEAERELWPRKTRYRHRFGHAACLPPQRGLSRVTKKGYM